MRAESAASSFLALVPSSAVGERGLVGEGGEVLLGGVDLGAGDRRSRTRRAASFGARVAEVGEGGVGAQPGLLGGGAERVALLGVGREEVVLGGGRPVTGLMTVCGGRRHGERGQQQPAGGGGLLDGGVELGEGVRAGTGPGRHLLGQLLGEAGAVR